MQLDTHKIIQLSRNKMSEFYLQTGRTISYDKASAEIGISKATLSRVLVGRKFDVDTLLRICTWLEIGVEEVVK